jgi:hypothetical protein
MRGGRSVRASRLPANAVFGLLQRPDGRIQDDTSWTDHTIRDRSARRSLWTSSGGVLVGRVAGLRHRELCRCGNRQLARPHLGPAATAPGCHSGRAVRQHLLGHTSGDAGRHRRHPHRTPPVATRRMPVSDSRFCNAIVRAPGQSSDPLAAERSDRNEATPTQFQLFYPSSTTIPTRPGSHILLLSAMMMENVEGRLFV